MLLCRPTREDMLSFVNFSLIQQNKQSTHQNNDNNCFSLFCILIYYNIILTFNFLLLFWIYLNLLLPCSNVHF